MEKIAEIVVKYGQSGSLSLSGASEKIYNQLFAIDDSKKRKILTELIEEYRNNAYSGLEDICTRIYNLRASNYHDPDIELSWNEDSNSESDCVTFGIINREPNVKHPDSSQQTPQYLKIQKIQQELNEIETKRLKARTAYDELELAKRHKELLYKLKTI